jgi:hypothetical protein
VAEGARLESVFTRKGNVGSNPTLSAIFSTAYRPTNHNKSLAEHDGLGMANLTTFEWACAISSVTTSP